MKKSRIVLPSGFLLLAVVVLAGCRPVRVPVPVPAPVVVAPAPDHRHGPPPWAPAHGHRAKYSYRYYRDAAVYYDPARLLYFHLKNGVWIHTKVVPFPGLLGLPFVKLEMDIDRPYKFHNHVLKKYPKSKGSKKKYKGNGRKK